MLQKTKILDRLINGTHRFFKVSLYARQILNLAQFHSGGDDYNPPANAEGLGGNIGNNPANSIIFAWRDSIQRKSALGEKRIYSVNSSDGTVGAEVYLKNDGKIEITGTADITITTTGTANIIASAVNLGGNSGAYVLTENSEITDGEGRTCTITSNTTKTKAV